MTDYFVDPDAGDDGNAGTSTGAAWATTQKAMNTVAAGDRVFLMNTAAETTTAEISTATNGTAASPIEFIGADSNGDPLNGSGQYQIQATLSGGVEDGIQANNNNYRFVDIRVTKAGGAGGKDGILLANASQCTLLRCRADGGWDSGFSVQTQDALLIQCEADGNTVGMDTDDFDNTFVSCSIHDNTGNGIDVDGQDCKVLDCLIYDNGGDGIDVSITNSSVLLKNNTIYGNSGDGINVADHTTKVLNNTSVSNGAYGYAGYSTNDPLAFVNNHSHGNTSGHTDSATTFADLGLGGNVTGDPSFASVTDGSEDFSPESGSPLLNAGVDGGTA